VTNERVGGTRAIAARDESSWQAWLGEQFAVR
jgi:hypothetical protein